MFYTPFSHFMSSQQCFQSVGSYFLYCYLISFLLLGLLLVYGILMITLCILLVSTFLLNSSHQVQSIKFQLFVQFFLVTTYCVHSLWSCCQFVGMMQLVLCLTFSVVAVYTADCNMRSYNINPRGLYNYSDTNNMTIS